jgi:hypothetical protein
MKEKPRKRITVTSSLNDQLANRVVVRGRGVTPPANTPYYRRVIYTVHI